MLLIPLQAIPNQTVTVNLANQACQIDVYQKRTGLYCNFWLNNPPAPTVAGRLCLDRTLIVRDAYFGFVGDIAFADQQGKSDPVYGGIGSRFLLYYYAPGDL